MLELRGIKLDNHSQTMHNAPSKASNKSIDRLLTIRSTYNIKTLLRALEDNGKLP